MKKIVLLLCCLPLLYACGGGEEIKPERPLEDIYADAYKEFNKKNYEEAAELFQTRVIWIKILLGLFWQSTDICVFTLDIKTFHT